MPNQLTNLLYNDYNIGDKVYYLGHKYYVNRTGRLVLYLVNEQYPDETVPVWYWEASRRESNNDNT